MTLFSGAGPTGRQFQEYTFVSQHPGRGYLGILAPTLAAVFAHTVDPLLLFNPSADRCAPTHGPCSEKLHRVHRSPGGMCACVCVEVVLARVSNPFPLSRHPNVGFTDRKATGWILVISLLVVFASLVISIRIFRRGRRGNLPSK